ncbi:MAG: biotin/lipoyl-binding protein, partial [Patescibacteria group bacterium]
MWRVLKLKKIWIPLLIVIIIVGAVSYARNQGSRPQYTTATVAEQNLKQTVSVTGTVEAAEDIELNFKTVGRLATMPYKVGDLVKVGDLLASLEASDSQAAVLTAQAQLQQAEASLDKLKAGSQEEDIAVYQAAVDVAKTTLANTRQALVNTKASQQQAVDNAWSKLVGLPAEA